MDICTYTPLGSNLYDSCLPQSETSDICNLSFFSCPPFPSFLLSVLVSIAISSIDRQIARDTGGVLSWVSFFIHFKEGEVPRLSKTAEAPLLPRIPPTIFFFLFILPLFLSFFTNHFARRGKKEDERRKRVFGVCLAEARRKSSSMSEQT